MELLQLATPRSIWIVDVSTMDRQDIKTEQWARLFQDLFCTDTLKIGKNLGKGLLVTVYTVPLHTSGKSSGFEFNDNHRRYLLNTMLPSHAPNRDEVLRSRRNFVCLKALLGKVSTHARPRVH